MHSLRSDCPHGAASVPAAYGIKFIPHRTLIGADGRVFKNFGFRGAIGFSWSVVDRALADPVSQQVPSRPSKQRRSELMQPGILKSPSSAFEIIRHSASYAERPGARERASSVCARSVLRRPSSQELQWQAGIAKAFRLESCPSVLPELSPVHGLGALSLVGAVGKMRGVSATRLRPGREVGTMRNFANPQHLHKDPKEAKSTDERQEVQEPTLLRRSTVRRATVK
ncbi:unnamed protein product [Polarella glacialis]|uniref:Uncharacterized protein n=1 Tax=Polarella glacialis TaxID=89957 RepID=A0A813GVQ2_POLGL|nr:unnamed protein product [Polarella glacialis]